MQREKNLIYFFGFLLTCNITFAQEYKNERIPNGPAGNSVLYELSAGYTSKNNESFLAHQYGSIAEGGIAYGGIFGFNLNEISNYQFLMGSFLRKYFLNTRLQPVAELHYTFIFVEDDDIDLSQYLIGKVGLSAGLNYNGPWKWLNWNLSGQYERNLKTTPTIKDSFMPVLRITTVF